MPMSGITSVSSWNYNPLQYLSQAAPSSSSQTASASSADQSAAASSSATPSAGTGVTSFQDQLAAAINDAIQKAEQSGNTSDLKSVIKDAVNQLLKDDGMDPQKLQQETTGQAQGAQHHHHHHHHGQGGGVDQGNGTTNSQQTSSQQTDSQTGGTAQADNTASQQGASQQITELLLQLSGSSGGNQSVTGLLINVQW